MAGYRRRTKGTAEYWELTWRENGQARTESLGRVSNLRESEVRRIAERKTRELILAAHTVLKPQQSFTAYAREYLDWHADEYPASSERIQQIIEQHILAHFKGTLDGVCQLDVEAYKKQRLRAGAAAETVAKELRTLSAMLNRAKDLGYIAINACKLVTRPKSLEQAGILFYTQDEMQAIYKACVEPWHKYAWMFYAGTGARRMEGLNLKWREVGTDELKLISTGEERTKSGQARALPLSIGAQEALEFFRTWEQRSDLYVLPRITPPSLSRRAAKCIARAKLPGSLHTFRHTFISRLAENSEIPVLAIKEWAGHSSLQVTEKYMHLRPSATSELLRATRI
jgi:integrase